MNILDENIPANQRQLLIGRRVRVQQIGFDLGRIGMQDDEIIPFLLAQRRPTFSRAMTISTSVNYAMRVTALCTWPWTRMKWPPSSGGFSAIPRVTRKPNALVR
jgi:hypothetical protein